MRSESGDDVKITLNAPVVEGCLFGNIANAKICDMTISDSSISSSGYHVGAFVVPQGTRLIISIFPPHSL